MDFRSDSGVGEGPSGHARPAFYAARWFAAIASRPALQRGWSLGIGLKCLAWVSGQLLACVPSP